jgi:hypothetical protein
VDNLGGGIVTRYEVQAILFAYDASRQSNVSSFGELAECQLEELESRTIAEDSRRNPGRPG